jgi:hypothetical protein
MCARKNHITKRRSVSLDKIITPFLHLSQFSSIHTGTDRHYFLFFKVKNCSLLDNGKTTIWLLESSWGQSISLLKMHNVTSSVLVSECHKTFWISHIVQPTKYPFEVRMDLSHSEINTFVTCLKQNKKVLFSI